MTLDEITKSLLTAGQLYPNVSLTVEAFKAWHEMFLGTDAKEFHAALMMAMKEPEARFFPAPGVVNKYIKQLHTRELPSVDDAWELTVKCASNFRTGLSTLEDRMPEAARAARQVGWERLCLGNFEKEGAFMRRDFVDAYGRNIEHEEEHITREEARNLLENLSKQIGLKKRGELTNG